MASEVRSNGTNYLKASVASFVFDPTQPIVLILDNWEYRTALSIEEARSLARALNEQIARLGVIDSVPHDSVEFVD